MPPTSEFPPLAARLAHGMDGQLAAADGPSIGRAEIELLARYLPDWTPLEISWHSPRPFSAAARVRCRQGEFFVKRHDRRVRDAAAVLEEHRFIAHLRSRGFPVPEPLHFARAAGSPTASLTAVSATASTTALEVDGATFEVHELATGVDLYADAHSWTPPRGPGHAHALGRALAELHLAAEGYDAPPRAIRPLLASFELANAPDLAAALDAFLRVRPAAGKYLERTFVTPILERAPGTQGASGAQDVPRAKGAPRAHLAPASRARVAILDRLGPWHACLHPLLPGLAPLWVHNDWHASNAFWTGDGADAQVASAVDFGLCNRGCAVADLATALERNTVSWLALDESQLDWNAGPLAADIGQARLARALLEGYEERRPLTAPERAALPILLPIAHAEFALSEVDYFAGVAGRDADAARACPGFLLGHVRWFEGPQGRAYLGQLEVALHELGTARAA